MRHTWYKEDNLSININMALLMNQQKRSSRLHLRFKIGLHYQVTQRETLHHYLNTLFVIGRQKSNTLSCKKPVNMVHVLNNSAERRVRLADDFKGKSQIEH